MKSYQNEHVALTVDCSIHLLSQTWIGIPSSDNFQQGSRVSFVLAQRHQIKRWLIDLQDLRLFNPTDLQWFIHHWLPKAEQTLSHTSRIAIVLNDLNQFSKQGSDLIVRASMSINPLVMSRYCLSKKEARQWLLQSS
ncbi:hypothetical protein GCM10028806_39200 [Spirosoma terrae]|uniref:STAS/SEC14 domain-containing protein n=1 Tax=Spirosoma terrae TaxID=1968276 RepID=A0A6L9LBE1_9BACT|nr:hypothetical protein [Spirosoma terrae]NDU97854.1 hypothetical protein [Spirosoma terrae]